jgi:hypothetical protein
MEENTEIIESEQFAKETLGRKKLLKIKELNRSISDSERDKRETIFNRKYY